MRQKNTKQFTMDPLVKPEDDERASEHNRSKERAVSEGYFLSVSAASSLSRRSKTSSIRPKSFDSSAVMK